MKKFLKTAVILSALTAALTCFVACEVKNVEDIVNVTLSGSTNGYYVKDSSKGSLYSSGGISDYYYGYYYKTPGLYISGNSTGCPAEFRIIGSSFSITVFENQSLNNNDDIYIYDKEEVEVGCVRVNHINDKLRLTYQETINCQLEDNVN